MPIAQGYGLTEASPIVTAMPLHLTEFTGSVGLPFPSTDVAIFDDARPQLGVGEVGEICARGSTGHGGLLADGPTKRRRCMFGDGWLRTGDVGRLDAAGYLFIEDRKKDVIVVSGFKVYPNEIEDVATRQAGVREAAAIGVPDAQSGEVVKLFVVRKDPKLTAADVVAHARAESDGLQGAAPRGVRRRAAEEQRRQSAAARAQGARRARQPTASPPK